MFSNIYKHFLLKWVPPVILTQLVFCAGRRRSRKVGQRIMHWTLLRSICCNMLFSWSGSPFF